MYDLNTIHAMNDAAAAKPRAETAFTRHCSYAKSPLGGLVLHSVLHRSTVYLEGKAATNFLVSWFATNSAKKRDRLVESFF